MYYCLTSRMNEEGNEQLCAPCYMYITHMSLLELLASDADVALP